MRSKKFKLAVIGCGRWGLNHVRTAHALFGEQLIYACDQDKKREAKVREVAPHISFSTQPEDIWKNSKINAVIIASTAETHYQLAKAALENGKHVLVEKPLSLFSSQAKELEKIAAECNKILMVGHLLLYHPAIKKIKQLIDNGTLGKLQYIYSNRLNLGTVRQEENILWSFAPHDISVLQYLTGCNPVAVGAQGGMFIQPGIHDVTLTTLEYPGNIQAHIHVSWLHPFKEHRLVVIGNKNMVVFEDSKATDKLVLYPKGIDWVNGEPIKRDNDYQVIEFEKAQPLQLEQKHFYTCVVEEKQPLTDGNNGVQVLEILEAAQACLERRIPAERGEKTAAGAHPERSDYFVHPTAVVDEGCQIGEGSKIWHFSHVQSGTSIGQKCSIGQNVNIGNQVKIGNYVKIQNNVSVYQGVELEDYVFCGPSMVFTNVVNPRCEFPQRGSNFYQPTLVKYGASIGANATIVCGTTIGRFAFIGAGAVVTKDVDEYALMVGNPARRVGWMCRCGVKLDFSAGSSAVCQKCGREYEKDDLTVTCINESQVK